MLRALLGLVVGLLLVPATSDAFLFQDLTTTGSSTNGVVRGPDGNLWVAETFNDSVVRIAPDGKVLNRFAVGAGPTTVANGPGDRVWVAVTGDKKLVWLDATTATPTVHTVATGSPCGPVGLAGGPDGKLYFSLPSDGACNGGVSQIGVVAGDGTGTVTRNTAGGGNAFDLEITNGKLFVPDFANDVIRRVALGTLAIEGTITTSVGGAPDGITSDSAGNVWVTEFNSGKLAHFPAVQADGAATEVTPTGGTLTNPFGVLAGADGRLYVTGSGSSNLVRLNGDGTGFAFYPVAGGAPWNIVNGTDGDYWITDVNKPRVLRFTNAPPRAQTAAATPDRVTATVDPRGNETQVVFDYGYTTAYGQTSPPQTVATGVGPVSVSAVLSNLGVGATYHVRARATNAEGESLGADTTFMTPGDAVEAQEPTPVPTPRRRLKAKTALKLKVRRSGATIVRSVVVSRLVGSETVTLRCVGKRCPFAKKAFYVKAGRRTFGRSLFRARVLGTGAKLIVRVTAEGAIGTSTTLSVRKGKRPKVVRK